MIRRFFSKEKRFDEIEVGEDQRDIVIRRLEDEVSFLRSLLQPKEVNELGLHASSQTLAAPTDSTTPRYENFGSARVRIERKLREAHQQQKEKEIV